MAGMTPLSVEQLRVRRGLKWLAHDGDVLPAWVAEMDYPVAPEISAALERMVRDQELGYPPLGSHGPVERLSAVFATRMHTRFGWRPDPAGVRLVADLEQAMIGSIIAFTDPGGAVVLQPPVYPPFRQCIVNAGRRPIDNPLTIHGGHTEIDWNQLDSRVEDVEHRPRMLLFCNPQNPTGRVFTRPELERLAEFACRHDLVVVSDEIHADITFDGARHIPLASISPAMAERTVTITSATKSFNIPGLRCGLMHFGGPDLHARFRTAVPDQLLGHPNIGGMRATLSAWESGDSWLDSVMRRLAANRERIRRALRDELVPLHGSMPEATFMTWLDATDVPCPDHASPSEFFLRQAQVAMNDGALFGPGGSGHVRLNFATSEAILEDIIGRLATSLRALG